MDDGVFCRGICVVDLVFGFGVNIEIIKSNENEIY